MIDARERARLVATVLAGFPVDSPRRLLETFRTLDLMPAYETELAYGLRASGGTDRGRDGAYVRDTAFFAVRASSLAREGLTPEAIGAATALGITQAERARAGFDRPDSRFPYGLRGDDALRQAWGLVLRDVCAAPALGAALILALDAGLTVHTRGARRVDPTIDVRPAAVAEDGARRWTF